MKALKEDWIDFVNQYSYTLETLTKDLPRIAKLLDPRKNKVKTDRKNYEVIEMPLGVDRLGLIELIKIMILQQNQALIKDILQS